MKAKIYKKYNSTDYHIVFDEPIKELDVNYKDLEILSDRPYPDFGRGDVFILNYLKLPIPVDEIKIKFKVV